MQGGVDTSWSRSLWATHGWLQYSYTFLNVKHTAVLPVLQASLVTTSCLRLRPDRSAATAWLIGETAIYEHKYAFVSLLVARHATADVSEGDKPGLWDSRTHTRGACVWLQSHCVISTS
jgi:hypothetical protein